MKEIKLIDWTLNQFEDAFFYKSKQGKFLDYANICIDRMKEAGHIGNAKVYERVVNMKLYDKKLKQRYLQDIDIKYVIGFNTFMEKRNWVGNTRKHDMKTLRAILNKAIKEKEYSGTSYHFGKGGFCIYDLEEETDKRYLSKLSLERIVNTQPKKAVTEIVRRLFLFSYFYYGMIFLTCLI